MRLGAGRALTGGGAGAGTTAMGGAGTAGGGTGVEHEASNAALATPIQAHKPRSTGSRAAVASERGAGSMSLMGQTCLICLEPGVAKRAHTNGWMGCIVDRLRRFAQYVRY
ncbi:hypothetical protein F9Z44_06375 [Hydrogenophaga sp. PBL-H3]|nr:hypothetical protein F9Z45_06375 [Hydrogenophaga sp. PBL-H3]QHE80132.1 hypothetical protein F9Z44_06375 [Hydrogenophaga sp. PBL-H3]